MPSKAFVDTNILLYLLCADAPKAQRAEELIGEGGVISIQVLNAFASVVDSMIVAAALLSGCGTLYSEDLHHRQRVDGLLIHNPFPIGV